MSLNKNNREDSGRNNSTTTSNENSDTMGGQYRYNPTAFNAQIDSTDDRVTESNRSIKARTMDTNLSYQISQENKGWKENDGQCLTERMKESHNLLIDNKNKFFKSSKRSNKDTMIETEPSKSSRLQRPRGSFKFSSISSISTSTNDTLISSLTKRLNEMSVKERQNAMYDLHGIPLDDEYYDTKSGVRGNTIERDPQELNKLVLELCRKVEERLKTSKSSYVEGDDFGEPRIFPRLTKEQQEELMLPVKETPTPPSSNPYDHSPKGMDGTHDSDATPNYKQWIQQRVRFLKHELDDKEFGEGLRLAKQQQPRYVDAQCIKFLRADRYDVNLASARMVRFFDVKRELFCAPGYKVGSAVDRKGCLGRNLRLTDFSKEDLKLWRTTGFLQLCGIRDRAKRAIVVIFGRVIAEANIPVALVQRAYLYVCNLLSRDELTQRAGAVVIGYDLFTDASILRNDVARNEQTAQGEDVGFYDDETKNNHIQRLIQRYLKQTYPVLSQMIKVGMSAQLRLVSAHYCFDHPTLEHQFEKLAGYMSTTAAARFRRHYANASNPETSILRASRSSKNMRMDKPLNDDSATTSEDKEKINTHIYVKKENIRNDDSDREENEKNHASMDSDINPHQELLYTLMTFGIPRETIPINESTGEIKLKFHQALLNSIEEYEHRDRLIEEATITESLSGSVNPPGNEEVVATDYNEEGGEKLMPNLGSSTNADKYWMGLTVSIGSNASFALFPNLAEHEEKEGGSDHSSVSLIRSKTNQPNPSPSSQKELSSKREIILSDFAPSSPPVPALLIRPAATTTESPRQSKSTSSNLEAPILIPTPNDVIMGRGPWNRSHLGNLRLKAMLERERDRYESVNRFERMRIVDSMLNELYYEFGARFLYKPKTKLSGVMSQTDDEPGSMFPLQIPSTRSDDEWLEAKRDKAHDKITHDFRNLRRHKQISPKPKTA